MFDLPFDLFKKLLSKNGDYGCMRVVLGVYGGPEDEEWQELPGNRRKIEN